MEENTGLQRALRNAAFKAIGGAIITTMALPTAYQWATSLNPNGILGATITLIVFGCIALSPVVLGCGFATNDLRKAWRIWRASRPNHRPRNHQAG